MALLPITHMKLYHCFVAAENRCVCVVVCTGVFAWLCAQVCVVCTGVCGVHRCVWLCAHTHTSVCYVVFITVKMYVYI